MRLLVTAGPTREPIDPVRFLSNRSTGAMGFALAREALARGHEVLLVLGPVADQPPVGVDVYAVETAEEMHAAVLDFLDSADAIICAAAVSDYRPATRSGRKLRSGALESIALLPTPDVAAAVGERRGRRPLAIFALETEDGPANARAKLERKNADVCVLNAPEAIGAEKAVFTLLFRDGSERALGEIGKPALAAALLDALGL